MGTTVSKAVEVLANEEHPHVCGDNFILQRSARAQHRNTPTYVGTTP